ncbi:ribonuclease HIII [Spiroplasma clarkii]|uniref:ribonuclease HIII n=1 Tax=Spiroplasma clarkii TaxID=2139 RepID=UPI000B56463D|nr:ribonuclease HIII [Spiroplasma clarkii]ARU91426.1 ribonuclease HIII [Spiroplasma clarkii]
MDQFSFKKVAVQKVKALINDLNHLKVPHQEMGGKLIYQPKDGATITIYQNNTILIQGKTGANYVLKYQLGDIQDPQTQVEVNFNEYNVLGSDEVGVGDFFGPIVVCCAYVPASFKTSNPSIFQNLKDSKTLTDHEITKVYLQIKDLVKHTVYIMGNKTYNDKYEQYQNINTLKCLAHNQVLAKFAQENQDLNINYILMDQFVEEKKYYEHLQVNKIKLAPYQITFKTKAESKSVAVASASIIARYYFLTAIKI